VPREVLHSTEEHVTQHCRQPAARLERPSREAEQEKKRVYCVTEDARSACVQENIHCAVRCDIVRWGGRSWLGCTCDTFYVCHACTQTAAAAPALSRNS